MKLTDLAIVVPEIKKDRKIASITSRIHHMRSYHRRHSANAYGWVHEERAKLVLKNLQNGGNKIISSLSRKRAPIDTPTHELLAWIFEGLRQPTARPITEYARHQLELLEQMSRTQRAATQKFLLGCEIAKQAKENWFMLFNTLTVRDEDYYNVFNQTSDAFQNYIRSVDRSLRRPGDTNITDHRQNHRYFAVVEEGAKNGRLHIHVLHFFRRPPYRAYDPNYGRRKPDKTLLYCMRDHWNYGRSEPIIVRYSPIDAWGKIGYRWPLDYKTGEPLTTGSPLRLASYIAKYITKSHTGTKRSKLLWRVRKSRHLGRELLDASLKNLSTPTLMLIATTDTITTTWNNWRIPPALLRQTAIKTLHDQNRSLSSTKEYASKTLQTLAKDLRPLAPLEQSPQGLTKTIRENNRSNTGFITTAGLEHEATYEHARTEFLAAATSIRRDYFPQSFLRKGSYPVTDLLR